MHNSVSFVYMNTVYMSLCAYLDFLLYGFSVSVKTWPTEKHFKMITLEQKNITILFN